jgi:hypothetical protein
MNAFWKGFGNVINLRGSELFEYPSDEEAFSSDWKAIGDDFRKSFEELNL